MYQSNIEYILFESPYKLLYGLTFFYFLFLYFIVGNLFLRVCKFLESKNFVSKIITESPSRDQIISEKKYSVLSIVIFGFSVLPIIYLIRKHEIVLLENSFLNVLIGVLILTLWNEIHFYVVHRAMHLPFLMKNVHKIHHQTKIPTIYSIYSFHPLEAFLLSTVPVTIVPLVPIAPIALFIYPFVSILLNLSGHCNYRFGNGTGKSWKLFGTHHNEHHKIGRKNYGFASNILDKIFNI